MIVWLCARARVRTRVCACIIYKKELKLILLVIFASIIVKTLINSTFGKIHKKNKIFYKYKLY